MSTPLAYTIPDACKMGAASRSAIYRAVKSGDLVLRIFALESVAVEASLFSSQPGTERAASTGGHKTATTKDGEVIDLTVWAAKYARRFQLVAALRKRTPDIFTSRVKGVKHDIRCPNSEWHGTPGDGGTFAVNASDLPQAGLSRITSGFVIH